MFNANDWTQRLATAGMRKKALEVVNERAVKARRNGARHVLTLLLEALTVR